MHIIARCPRCGYRWWLNAAAADRRLRCRKCFRLLKVPDLTEVPQAAGLVDQARSRVFVDETGRAFG
jgi:tRNA(Ile2) C34 agmatinyltransferase TiaS